MSTIFLYHSFGLVGYDNVRTRYAGGAVIFSIKRKRGKFRCSFCRSRISIFSAFLSSAALVKLKLPVMTVSLSMIMILLCAMACSASM